MRTFKILLLVLSVVLTSSCKQDDPVTLTGELKQWHKITLSIQGPELSEQGIPNPFLDYRLNVRFFNDEAEYNVPGYFAADGRAAESSADAGSMWKVHFAPPTTGEWNYELSFKKGENIAVSDDPGEGEPVVFDGYLGSFTVDASDKSGKDFRSKGRLAYKGERYLQHMGNGEYFLKGGADSPENFLGYAEFDGTLYG